jgi:hypothetical protein
VDKINYQQSGKGNMTNYCLLRRGVENIRGMRGEGDSIYPILSVFHLTKTQIAFHFSMKIPCLFSLKERKKRKNVESGMSNKV